MDDPQHDSDLALLAAWRSGDAAAGNQLCLRFQPKLRRFFGSKVPPPEVDELVSRVESGKNPVLPDPKERKP